MDNILSVIVPIKNMEQYIEECLNSILDSTLKASEIIVIDFGSQDSSLDIINRYAKLHENIKVVEDPGGDAASARNVGLKHANGEYIAFVDCDDWIAPNMFQTLYDSIQQGDWDVVSCNYRNIYPDGREEIITCPEHSCIIDANNLNRELVWMALGGMGAEIWTKLYRKSFLTEHNIYFDSENGVNGEDVFFNYCVLLNNAKVRVIQDVLYFHRIRANSLSHKKTTKLTKRFKTIILKLLQLADTLKTEARQGIAQLLISLIIQDVMSVETEEEKVEVLREYLSDSVILSLSRSAVFQPGISVKRRMLIALLACKLPTAVVRLWR